MVDQIKYESFIDLMVYVMEGFNLPIPDEGGLLYYTFPVNFYIEFMATDMLHPWKSYFASRSANDFHFSG